MLNCKLFSSESTLERIGQNIFIYFQEGFRKSDISLTSLEKSFIVLSWLVHLFDESKRIVTTMKDVVVLMYNIHKPIHDHANVCNLVHLKLEIIICSGVQSMWVSSTLHCHYINKVANIKKWTLFCNDATTFKHSLHVFASNFC